MDQKGNFPGPVRQAAIAIVVNNKAYAGMGTNGGNGYYNDWYSYNDTTDSWIPLINFPGTSRGLPFGFGINGKVYVGAGSSASGMLNDFWEYNPSNNSWTQKTNFPGTARFAVSYFSLNGKGYAGIGKNASTAFYDFYVYDPIFNSWAQRASFPDTSISVEEGFALGSLGYSGCGAKPSGALQKKFWQYTPDGVGVEENHNDAFEFSLYPNPATNELAVSSSEFREIESIEIYSSLGEKVFFQPKTTNRKQQTIDVSQLPPGIYFITVTDQAGNKVTKKVVKM